jgi:hypothetical protein
LGFALLADVSARVLEGLCTHRVQVPVRAIAEQAAAQIDGAARAANEQTVELGTTASATVADLVDLATTKTEEDAATSRVA